MIEREDKMTKTSFGEYFDNQRDKIVKDMQDKNKQQNVEWMERFEKRKKMAKEMLLPKKTVKQRRKDMLKKYEGKLEGPYDHLKEGVDYLDDIQSNKK